MKEKENAIYEVKRPPSLEEIEQKLRSNFEKVIHFCSRYYRLCCTFLTNTDDQSGFIFDFSSGGSLASQYDEIVLQGPIIVFP